MDSPTAPRRRLLRALAALALGLGPWAGSAAVASDRAPAAATSELAPRIEQMLAARVAADGPGVAVLVARGEVLLYRGARGLASIRHRVPLSPDHVFRIGSVAKQMTAAAVLAQADAGRLSADDPLARFLPDFPGAAGITLGQLMDHTAGVANLSDQPGYLDGEVRLDRSTAELIARFRDLPPDFAPGTAWRYSNSGYVLLGAVLEQLGGRPWHEAVAALTAPLGMSHTAWGDHRRVVPGMAEGYSTEADGGVQRARPISMTQPHAAGALVSSVDDLWRWQQALYGGRVLSAASLARMTTPHGPVAEQARYAYGLLVQTLHGEPMWHHGGGIHGYLSSLLYLPSSRITVAVLRNSDGPGLDPNRLARELAALALGRPYPDGPTVAVPLAERERLAGTWRLAGAPAAAGASPERVLRVAGETLTSQRAGGPVLPLRHIGGGVWLFSDSLSRIEQQADGRLRVIQDGEGDGELWQRVGEVPPERQAIALDDAQRAALLGEYASVAPPFRFRVFVDDAGVLRGQAPGQPALALHAQTPRQLYVTEVDARFEFEPAEGAARTLRLIQGAVRLELQRQP